MRDRMQHSRFELKYLVREETAQRISDFVLNHMDLDPYGVGQPHRSYEVHSLYVDSDDLKTYWWTVNGDRNRFKLRLRFYGSDPESPVYCEIKRRHNNCILKQRGAVTREILPQILAGQLPKTPMPGLLEPAAALAVQNFCCLASRLQARPKVHIAYLREAYLHEDGHLRVTLDRRVLAEEHLRDGVPSGMVAPVLCFPGSVILELKFTDRFPVWFRELVETFEVIHCGVPKYCEALQNLGAKRVRAVGPVLAPTFTPREAGPPVEEEVASAPVDAAVLAEWDRLPTPMWLPPPEWRKTFVSAKKKRRSPEPTGVGKSGKEGKTAGT